MVVLQLKMKLLSQILEQHDLFHTWRPVAINEAIIVVEEVIRSIVDTHAQLYMVG